MNRILNNRSVTRKALWPILLSLTIFLVPTSSSWAQNAVEECLSKSIREQIGCLSDRSVKKKDASPCDASQHEGLKYQCYAMVAEKLGNWKTCLHIPAKSVEHRELRDVCISDVAEKNRNYALCKRYRPKISGTAVI